MRDEDLKFQPSREELDSAGSVLQRGIAHKIEAEREDADEWRRQSAKRLAMLEASLPTYEWPVVRVNKKVNVPDYATFMDEPMVMDEQE